MGGKELEMEKGICKVCHRLHEPIQPGPLRIANAYTMQPQALESLTDGDRDWMKEHPNFSALDILEDALADLM